MLGGAFHAGEKQNVPIKPIHTDLGVMKALGEKDARRVLEAGEAWRPWRAYAVMHFWNSQTKE
jgi:3-methyladenine DNA glycosylase/8-oxoguanine DNA glycosylase